MRSVDATGWEVIGTLANRHGLLGLVSRGLDWAHERTGVRPPVLDRLAAARRGQLVQLLRYRGAARRVAETLTARGVRVVIYKGAVLAEEVYGDLSLRAFRDCDILVHPNQLRLAYAVLQELGYTLAYENSLEGPIMHGGNAVALSHPDGSAVDLHWSIAGGEVMPKDPEIIWRYCGPQERAEGLPGWRMSPELTLINLATHFYRHEYREVKPLVDFYTAAIHLGPRIDVEELFAAARALDMEPMLDLAARLCERLLMPNPLIARLAPAAPSLRVRLACAMLTEQSLLRQKSLGAIEGRFRRFLYGGSLASSAKEFRKMLAPGASELELRFAEPFRLTMYPRYYLMQVYRTVTRTKKPFSAFVEPPPPRDSEIEVKR